MDNNFRENILNTCVALFGLEDATTIAAYDISEKYPDDTQFATGIVDYLFGRVVEAENEESDEVYDEPADIDDDTNYDPYTGQLTLDDMMEEGW